MQVVNATRICEAHDPDSFWAWFSRRRGSLEARLAASVAPGCDVSHLTMTNAFGDLLRELRAYDGSLGPVLRRGADGCMILIVSVDAAVEVFSSAKTLVASAPHFADWSILALRPRTVPRTARGRGVSVDVEDLRVTFALANGRISVAVLGLAEHRIDPVEARHVSRRLVAELLGEEDYALFVSDVAYLTQEAWAAASPGGVCVPPRLFAASFDAIFHRERAASRARVEPAAPVAQVA